MGRDTAAVGAYVPLTPWNLSTLGEQVAGTIIIGEPVPKGRPRVNRSTGTMYTPVITRKAEARIRERLERVRPIRPVLFPVVLWLTFHCSCSERSVADGDNLAKLCADAGIGVIYANDRQIVEWHIRTYTGATQARTEWVATCLPR